MNSTPDNHISPAAKADSRAPSRWCDVVFFLAALAMIYAMRPVYFTDWDSFDYTVAAVNGQPSSLATGRMSFIGMHHLAWRLAHGVFGLQPQHAWQLFQGLTMALGALATVAVFRAAWHLTRSAWTAIIAGFFWLLAPQAMIYAGAIMTETPTVLWFCAAVILTEMAARHRRGGRLLVLTLLAGGAFAMAANMREPLVLFGLYFAGRTLLAPDRAGRWRVGSLLAFGAAFTIVYGAMVLWAAHALGGLSEFWGRFDAWRAYMSEERFEYPNSPRHNLFFLVLCSASVSLLGLVWAIPALLAAALRWRQRRREAEPVGPAFGPLGWLLLGNAAYAVSLLSNHDMDVNPRFALPFMMPLLLLESAVLADVTIRRAGAWLAVLAAAAAVAMALMVAPMSWHLSGWLPSNPAMRLEHLVLLALATGAAFVLAHFAARAACHRRQLSAAAGLVALAGTVVVMIGWPALELHYLRQARWQKQFVDDISGPGGVPADALLIPSKGTPAVQYLINMHIKDGWILPGPPYEPAGKLAEAQAAAGWVVAPSGWCWPDGDCTDPGRDRLALIELVEAFHRAGRPVYIYGGPSSWVPGPGRRDEWPEVLQIQQRYEVEPAGPGEMCRVRPTPPRPGQKLIPLGKRKHVLEKQAAGRQP